MLHPASSNQLGAVRSRRVLRGRRTAKTRSGKLLRRSLQALAEAATRATCRPSTTTALDEVKRALVPDAWRAGGRSR